MWIKRRNAVLAALLLSTQLSAGKKAAKVEDLERQFYLAWQAHSLDAVENNIAPEGISWSEWGILDKTAQIANQKAANANCNVRSFAFRDVRTTAAGRDSVLLTYTLVQDAPCGQGSAPSPLMNSSLWVKRGGRWLNVYRASVSPRKMN